MDALQQQKIKVFERPKTAVERAKTPTDEAIAQANNRLYYNRLKPKAHK
jgi:hypothetical protein